MRGLLLEPPFFIYWFSFAIDWRAPSCPPPGSPFSALCLTADFMRMCFSPCWDAQIDFFMLLSSCCIVSVNYFYCAGAEWKKRRNAQQFIWLYMHQEGSSWRGVCSSSSGWQCRLREEKRGGEKRGDKGGEERGQGQRTKVRAQGEIAATGRRDGVQLKGWWCKHE